MVVRTRHNNYWERIALNKFISFGAEAPAFEVLPSLKRLKQRIIAASRGEYDAVLMSGRYKHHSNDPQKELTSCKPFSNLNIHSIISITAYQFLHA